MERQAKAVVERCGNIPVYPSTPDVLTQLTGFQLTRGVLCAMHRKPIPTARELLKKSRRVAVLENIVNPTNLGAIFRSAAALGMDAVLITPACTDPLYRRSVRVSMGTVFQVPWTYIGEKNCRLARTGEWRSCREMGFKTAAMALSDDSVSIDCPELLNVDKLAVILGTER